MPRLLLAAVLTLVLALFSPLLFLPRTDEPDDPPAEETEESAPLPPSGTDAELTFFAKDGDSVAGTNMYDYLPGAVAAEMPALFETEALKAQAVAARTYIMELCAGENPKHPEAQVCSDPNCCKGWLSDAELHEKWGDDYETNMARILEAVRGTDGEYLAYEGEPIQAVFHASSGGSTEASAAVWADEPYLRSVTTPETEENVPGLVTEVELTAEEVRAAAAEYCPEAELSGAPDSWFGAKTLTESGRVDSITLGGAELSGGDARRAFSLRSTDFDVEYADGRFIFTVRGYGHGVGMSQQGANLLAEEGLDYAQILAHYYPGTELCR